MQTTSETEVGVGGGGDLRGAEGGAWELEFQPQGGGVLVAPTETDLEVGDALAVTLTLSTGVQIRYAALVRGVIREAGLPEQGRRRVVIEFCDLSAAERHEFRRWQIQIQRERGCSRVTVGVERAGSRGTTLVDWVNERLEAAGARRRRTLHTREWPALPSWHAC